MILTSAALLMIVAGQAPGAGPATPLTGHAAEVYRQAQGGKWFADAAKLKPDVRPTSDGQSFLVVWKQTPRPARWIVTLHGTQGFATDDLAIWSKTVRGRDIGLVCVQWWLGAGDGPSAYYTPAQVYREIDAALKQLDAVPGAVMFHGFSRGAANSYAIAAIDAAQGRRYFSLVVASSGGVNLGYPPNAAIVRGDLGAHPLEGTRWVTAAGGRDPNPERDGIPAMRRTADWLKAQGAIVVDAIEDKNQGHGALQTNPKNASHLLDLFTRR